MRRNDNNVTTCRMNSELGFRLIDCLPELLCLLTFVSRPPPPSTRSAFLAHISCDSVSFFRRHKSFEVLPFVPPAHARTQYINTSQNQSAHFLLPSNRSLQRVSIIFSKRASSPFAVTLKFSI